MKSARTWILIVVALVIGLGAWFFWQGRTIAVTVARAHEGSAVELVYATGFVEAQQPVAIASRVTAPVMRILVAEGERVRRGQALVLLDDSEQRGLLSQAAAQRRGAVQDESRTLALVSRGWVTRASRDKVVSAANAARAAEASAIARLDQYVLRAGIDGVVLKRDVEPGDLAVPSRTLMQLGDPARIRITATVDERDVPRIRVGQPAMMSSDAWPGRIIRAHVSEITPGGDPNQRAFRARLLTDKPETLPIGLTLEVNVVTRRTDRALLVPASALIDDHVWVIEDNHVASRAVKTGIVGADEVEILSGLKAGDMVVTAPPGELAEGKRVKVGKP
jgi:RND family efflux transporter MFP subunit